MAGTKRKAEQATRAAAARRARARRRAGWAVALGVAAVGLVIALSAASDDAGDKAADLSAGIPTTTLPTSSAAGEPCIPVSSRSPAGAPAVPVREGPPPAQLLTEDVKEGTGAVVTAGSTVTVHYIGVACSTGKIFDSSWARREPVTFPLTGVIKGWQDGIPGMRVGGQRFLGIPADQAYGPAGRPPTIRPDEALWFVVDVLEVK